MNFLCWYLISRNLHSLKLHTRANKMYNILLISHILYTPLIKVTFKNKPLSDIIMLMSRKRRFDVRYVEKILIHTSFTQIITCCNFVWIQLCYTCTFFIRLRILLTIKKKPGQDGFRWRSSVVEWWWSLTSSY